jgi:anti-sigma factor RsiW
MNCDQARLLLHPYLDDQLDVVQSLRIVEHLSGCPACEESRARIQDLSLRVGKSDLRYYAPATLSRRIRTALAEVDQPARPEKSTGRRRRRLFVALATVAGLVLAAVGFAVGRSGWLGTANEERLAGDVTEAHVRSLLANHLVDVASTDQHTVKPWFVGKLDFAAPVVDMSDQGFTLAGGRLDVLDLHPVAALIYRRRQHAINVFVWPATTADRQLTETTRRGYTLLYWTAAGRTCWIVSDLNAEELREFAALFRLRLEPAAGS